MLLEKLINLKLVVDNEHARKYCNLIELNLNNSHKPFETQRHPQYWFTQNSKTVIDNDNIVNLTHRDHLLAHYYLSLCAYDEYGRNCNSYAAYLMLQRTGSTKPGDITAKELDQYSELYAQYTAAASKRMSNSVFMNKDGKNTTVLRSNISSMEAEGWVLGRYWSEDEKLRFSEAVKNGMKNVTYDHAQVSERARRSAATIRSNPTLQKEISKKISEKLRGRTLSDTTVSLLREKAKQLRWVTNGIETLRVTVDELEAYLSQGYRQGRSNQPNSFASMSEETKAERAKKISASLKGREFTAEHRRKLGEATRKLKGTRMHIKRQMNDSSWEYKFIRISEFDCYSSQGWVPGSAPRPGARGRKCSEEQIKKQKATIAARRQVGLSSKQH